MHKVVQVEMQTKTMLRNQIELQARYNLKNVLHKNVARRDIVHRYIYETYKKGSGINIDTNGHFGLMLSIFSGFSWVFGTKKYDGIMR